MAVWWVFQNKSFFRSRDGGYLWAPLRDRAGSTKSHWESMSRVVPGDVVLSCKDRALVAVSVAKTAAYESPQPDPEDAKDWVGGGRRVDVAYVDLPHPFSVDSFSDLFDLLRADGGPIQLDGRGKLGYLFQVHPRAAQLILARLNGDVDIDLIIETGEQTSQPGRLTTSIQLVEVRLGQQRFRESLKNLWRGRCAVTGIDDERLLIASHVKPWRLCNHMERLDPNSGLLLEARIDRLFDTGVVSFTADGSALISSALSSANVQALGMHSGLRLSRTPSAQQESYLQFHRANVFIGGARFPVSIASTAVDVLES